MPLLFTPLVEALEVSHSVCSTQYVVQTHHPLHDRIRQIVPFRALMGISVRLLLFRLLAWDKDASRRSIFLLASYRYRGHIIRVEVKQNPDSLYWEASRVIEVIEGGTSHTFSDSGAIKTFKTEAEAKRALLQQAKRWIYDRIGS